MRLQVQVLHEAPSIENASVVKRHTRCLEVAVSKDVEVQVLSDAPANVVELAYITVLEAVAFGIEGSTPSISTISIEGWYNGWYLGL